MIRQACLIQNLSLEVQEHKALSQLTFQLPYSHCCGLTGRNGQGKSLLMAALADELTPSINVNVNGSIQWQCAYAYLPQLQRLTQNTIAQALDIQELANAFTRIEQGHAPSADYDLVEQQWHLPQQWQQTLEQALLPTALDYPVERLSEGQKTRLALCRLFLLPDHYLLLDEPSNHLDQSSREWLIHATTHHPAGCLIISHDRILLDHMQHIFALDNLGLHFYGGNYTHYKEQHDLQITALASSVGQQKRDLKQLRQQQLATQAKAQKRQQMGQDARQSSSQAKIILDAQKERAGQTQAKLIDQQTRQFDQARKQLQEDQSHLEYVKPQQFIFQHHNSKTGTVLHLNDIGLIHGCISLINLTITGREHIHLAGINGSGKSTLLKTIHGELAPTAGILQKSVNSLYLDQNFSFLNPQLSAAENLHNINPFYSETQWRNLLGQFRLRRDKGIIPLGQLSGGEQLKVALLAISQHQKNIGLLLLDEPENHLDIESRDLLASAIRQFPGAVLLVSHDPAFVTSCAVHRIIQMNHFS